MNELKTTWRERAKDREFFGGLRSIVLKRDNYTCIQCGMTDAEHRKRWDRSITVDHIDGSGCSVPKEKKNNSLRNLQTLCCVCHGKKDSNNPNGKRITHCKYGHEYTPKNTRVGTRKLPSGNIGTNRFCRICRKEYAREYHLLRKELKS